MKYFILLIFLIAGCESEAQTPDPFKIINGKVYRFSTSSSDYAKCVNCTYQDVPGYKDLFTDRAGIIRDCPSRNNILQTCFNDKTKGTSGCLTYNMPFAVDQVGHLLFNCKPETCPKETCKHISCMEVGLDKGIVSLECNCKDK